MEPMHQWGAQPLGKRIDENMTDPNRIALLVKGQLLRRYPNTAVYAWKRRKRRAGRTPSKLVKDAQRHCRRTRRRSRCRSSPASSRPTSPSSASTSTRKTIDDWCFVLEEQMTEPRFGFDVDESPRRPAAAAQGDRRRGLGMRVGAAAVRARQMPRRRSQCAQGQRLQRLQGAVVDAPRRGRGPVHRAWRRLINLPNAPFASFPTLTATPPRPISRRRCCSSRSARTGRADLDDLRSARTRGDTMPLLDLNRQAIAKARAQLAAAAQRAARRQRRAPAGAEPNSRRCAAAVPTRERGSARAAARRERSAKARAAAATARETSLRVIVELSEGLRRDARPGADGRRRWPRTHPVLLMPVAVQTRYDDATTQLMIRIYPDALHGFTARAGPDAERGRRGQALLDAALRRPGRRRFALAARSRACYGPIARRLRRAHADADQRRPDRRRGRAGVRRRGDAAGRAGASQQVVRAGAAGSLRRASASAAASRSSASGARRWPTSCRCRRCSIRC